MRHSLIRIGALATAVPIALGLAACAGSPAGDPTVSGTTDNTLSGKVSVTAVWSGSEQDSFQAILDEFEAENPGVTVEYTSAGNNLPTVLSTSVTGGNPPDIAAIPQPALVDQFHADGALKPLDFAEQTLTANFPADIVDIGRYDDGIHSFVFKAGNKSTLWYNPAVLADAGVQPPTTWDELLAAAGTIRAAGVAPFAIPGADGWTLTDLFENIYLRQAGPDAYDQLAAHEIPWTDPTVVKALQTMADLFGTPGNIAGGNAGALETDLSTASGQVVSKQPVAAFIAEGDFVPSTVANIAELQAGTDYDVTPFPSINDSPDTVVGGGDLVVLFSDNPIAKALIEYLASPQAAQIWVERGGFSSPNSNVPASAYPNDLARTTATAIASAEVFRFDMSDLAPVAFGGTTGQGLFKLLQDLLADPTQVEEIAAQLESAAAAAYAG